MKKCRWFKIEELVAPEILADIGEEQSWDMVAEWVDQLDMIRVLSRMRLHLNSKNGRRYAGVRPLDCKIGAKMSIHKLVKPHISAWDFVCNDLVKLEKVVRNNWRTLGIVRIENPLVTVGWLHVEFCSLGSNRLVVFNP